MLRTCERAVNCEVLLLELSRRRWRVPFVGLRASESRRPRHLHQQLRGSLWFLGCSSILAREYVRLFLWRRPEIITRAANLSDVSLFPTAAQFQGLRIWDGAPKSRLRHNKFDRDPRFAQQRWA